MSLGKAGLGNYTVKGKFAHLRKDPDSFESMNLVCHTKDIVN